MLNRLQYAYSITVFFGVLLTAYLMMNREGGSNTPLRAFQASSYRTEAQMMDPAVIQLIEMETALSELRNKNVEELKRTPTDSTFHLPQ